MKTLKLSLLFGAALAALSLFAADPIVPQLDLYPERLATFTGHLERDLRGIRAEADRTTGDASLALKMRYAEVYTLLNRCEDLVGQMKIASSLELGSLRSDYETTHAQLLAALKVARGE